MLDEWVSGNTGNTLETLEHHIRPTSPVLHAKNHRTQFLLVYSATLPYLACLKWLESSRLQSRDEGCNLRINVRQLAT